MIDRAEIKVRAGKGGNGAISFRHEKFVPFGGPDGGDGGKGGDVIMVATRGISTLRRYSLKHFYAAENGGDGGGRKMHGKNGKHSVLEVPEGTMVLEKQKGAAYIQVADLTEHRMSEVVARGGSGGLGNTHFTSSTNQAPNISQRGEEGEEKDIVLELRLIADAGIVGYPNCGKSTLVASSSAARPKIGEYPFTTLEPVLGVVEVGEERFILAEIPGLIEGAHLGKGLGHEFLRHVARTRVLINMVDGASEKPEEDMARVNAELAMYDKALSSKLQLVVVNKIDLPSVRNKEAELRRSFGKVGIKPYFISASTGEGVGDLMADTKDLIEKEWSGQSEARMEEEGEKLFQPGERINRPRVCKEGDIFYINSSGLERIVEGGGSGTEAYWYVRRRLERQGINRVLKRKGIRPGDKIRCGSVEWEWREGGR